jgi:ribosomal protein S18 acetylase RimI-like enzyme
MQRKIDDIQCVPFNTQFASDILDMATQLFKDGDYESLKTYLKGIKTWNDVSFILKSTTNNQICGFACMRFNSIPIYSGETGYKSRSPFLRTSLHYHHMATKLSKISKLSSLEIAFLGIHPNYQGMGIGSYILSNILRVYTNIPIWLHCNLDNIGAKKLYEKFGFFETDIITDKYGTQCYVMQKIPLAQLFKIPFLSGLHREYSHQTHHFQGGHIVSHI